MVSELKRIHAFFYHSPTGQEPAREWLKGRTAADRKIIGTDFT